MKDKLAYFAHPITWYNTLSEELLVHFIEKNWMNYEIFNPNQLWLQRVYQARKDAGDENHFAIFTEISSVCDITIGNTFFDGTLGVGIFSEMLKTLTRGGEATILKVAQQPDSEYDLIVEDVVQVHDMRDIEAACTVLTLEETRDKVHVKKEL